MCVFNSQTKKGQKIYIYLDWIGFCIYFTAHLTPQTHLWVIHTLLIVAIEKKQEVFLYTNTNGTLFLCKIFTIIHSKSLFQSLASPVFKWGSVISHVRCSDHLGYCHTSHPQCREGRWKVIPVCVSVSENPARAGECNVWLSVKEAFVYFWL